MEASESTRFLVVDDFEHMRKIMQSTLLALGYRQITLVADGKEAVNYLSSKPVDCIISDWNMPKMTGIELLHHVRSDPKLKNISFMMMTAEGQRQQVHQAIDAGVDQFLVKPFTQGGLRTKIQSMVKRSRQVREQVAKPNKPEEKPEAGQPKTTAKERSEILVVDDAPRNIDILHEVLKSDFKVKAATSGKAAIRICQSEQRPDLILLDVMMPEMDGFEVCQRLKQHPDTEAIPIIFLTAKSETVDITRGLELGAVDYITKPSNPAILLARVKTHIRLIQSRAELEEKVDTLLENARLREDVERMTRHDLKNPLAAIIANSEAIATSDDLPAHEQQQIAMIHDAALSILSMVNRTLDLYKMEIGSYRLKPQRVELAELLRRVIENIQAEAAARNIRINFNAPGPCYSVAEELLCFSLLGNLLRNAVEASPDAQDISILLESGDRCKIQINNKGVVPEAIRPNLFEKYVTAGKANGTGLGCYSAKLMTEIQGGKISFISKEETGTTFTVELPGNSQ